MQKIRIKKGNVQKSVSSRIFSSTQFSGNVQKSVSSRIFSSTQFSIYLERKYQVET